MPPYVVLSDRHLEGIVEEAPATLAALAKCKGIGPMKLERWGDEILAVLARRADADGPQ
jgi:superfamily II DNA helicase RecQ